MVGLVPNSKREMLPSHVSCNIPCGEMYLPGWYT